MSENNGSRVPLRDYVDEIFERLKEHFDQNAKDIRAYSDQADKNLQEEIRKTEKFVMNEIGNVEVRTSDKLQVNNVALDKALIALNERLETMNQFRQQINSERGLYVTRDMMDLLLKPLQKRSDESQGAEHQIAVDTNQSNDSTARIVGFIAIGLAGIDIIIKLIGR